jgi:hypothetical protein
LCYRRRLIALEKNDANLWKTAAVHSRKRERKKEPLIREADEYITWRN